MLSKLLIQYIISIERDSSVKTCYRACLPYKSGSGSGSMVGNYTCRHRTPPFPFLFIFVRDSRKNLATFEFQLPPKPSYKPSTAIQPSPSYTHTHTRTLKRIRRTPPIAALQPTITCTPHHTPWKHFTPFPDVPHHHHAQPSSPKPLAAHPSVSRATVCIWRRNR